MQFFVIPFLQKKKKKKQTNQSGAEGEVNSKKLDVNVTAAAAATAATAATTWMKSSNFGSLYWKAVVQKGDYLLNCFIEVSSEYPLKPPIFKLALQHSNNNNKLTQFVQIPDFVKKNSNSRALELASQSSTPFDLNVKAIEVDINTQYPKFCEKEQDNLLLSFQISRLLVMK